MPGQTTSPPAITAATTFTATVSRDAPAYLDAIRRLCNDRSHRWCSAYRSRAGRPTHILQVVDHDMTYLFDLVSTLLTTDSAAAPNAPHDRVVVMYGRSGPAIGPRDANRMRGFIGGSLPPVRGHRRDKGHFASHAQGGGLDINLFPQRTDVNRGWSPRGKDYRAMETYCARIPGTFFYARPLYRDHTWVPHEIEYGVLRAPGDLWVDRFPN